MNLRKEWDKIFEEVLKLPIPIQNIVVDDVIETVKNRIMTMRKIVGN